MSNDKMLAVATLAVWCFILKSTRSVSVDPGQDSATDQLEYLRPGNTVAVAGQTALLQCNSDPRNTSRWDYHENTSSLPVSVSNGDRFETAFHRRFLFQCGQDDCNMTVDDVRLSDAGFYIGFESSNVKKKAETLTVLANDPVCSSNISLPGNAVQLWDSIRVNCSVEYKGPWKPGFTCSPKGQVVPNSPSKNLVTHSVVMKVSDIKNQTTVRCATTFVLSDSFTDDKPIVTDPVPPVYSHTWQSPPIRVTNLTAPNWRKWWKEVGSLETTPFTTGSAEVSSTWVKNITKVIEEKQTWQPTATTARQHVSNSSVVTGATTLESLLDSKMLIILLICLLAICLIAIILLAVCRSKRKKREPSDVRRALPQIPLATVRSTTASSSQQRQREAATAGPSTFQTSSSTPFYDDNGHYTDIHPVLTRGDSVSPGMTRVATWRRSFVDEPGHYNYIEVGRVAGQAETGQSERPSNYEGLDPAAVAALRQPQTPHQYAGIGRDPPCPGLDAQGYLVVQPSVYDGDNGIQVHVHVPSTSQNGNATTSPPMSSRLEGSAVGVSRPHPVNTQGYEGLHPASLEELRRPQRVPADAGPSTTRSDVDSYLEPVEHPDSDDQGNLRTSGEGYEGLDPAELEEFRRRRSQPHDYAGLKDIRPTGGDGNGGMDNRNYQGLDPDDMEPPRHQPSPPREEGGTDGSVEDLYSRPVKRAQNNHQNNNSHENGKV